MRVIVVNSGSSSIKYEAFELSGLVATAKGLLERIGAQDSRLKHRWLTPSGKWEEIVETRHIADHREGFSFILEVSSRAQVRRRGAGDFRSGPSRGARRREIQSTRDHR